MITALVQFPVPDPMPLDKAREAFSRSAHKYHGVPGLVRKYFLVSEDRRTVGGVYLWHSRQDAEQFYSQVWSDGIRDKYGDAPTVTYFDSPVVVENPDPGREPDS